MDKRDLLIQIDKLITNCNEKNFDINSIFDLCSEYLDIDTGSIFSDILVPKQKNFLVAILVRIAGINENLIWNLPDRYKVFAMIKDILEPDCRIYNISEKELKDNSALLRKIRDIASEFEEEYSQFSKKMININSLTKFPTSFLKFINHKKYKFLIDSFCDTNLFNPDAINKLFENIAGLSSENVSEGIESQQKLVKLISGYLANIKKIERTDVERITIISCLEKINTILQDNLPEEHKIRIADLAIEDIERKYPFHKTNEVFEIKFKIVNFGGGEALNTTVKIKNEYQHLQIPNQEIYLGDIQTHTVVVANAVCNQNIDMDSVPLKIEISWNDIEGRSKQNSKEILLLRQNSNIDWETQKNPYSLDATKGKDDFIGRKEIIKKILSNYEKETFESSIITGQKRVGKSSIGRAIETILREKDKYIVIYISVNELDNRNADTFINTFGETIYSELKCHLEKLDYKLPNISFDGSLFPLLNALKNIRKDTSRRKEEYKIIFIVDEFDEIPIQIINNPEIGNAFFQNIRSLIDKREYTEFLGLILIGGENMGFINQSTQRFNKFNLHYVDYFDKGEYWTDFIELVTKPAKNIIEYSPDLLNLLYEYTEGNPFYTNLLCKHLFDYGITNKISYLTDNHLKNILSEKLVEMGSIHFSHFWMDYILEEDTVKRDKIETQRRKFLIAYAQLKRDNKLISDNTLSKKKSLENVSISKIRESFVNRKIFVPMTDGSQEYRFKPRFAEKWLIEYGCNELMSSFTNEEAMQIYDEKDKESYVSDKEILSFIEHNNLTAYRSRPIEIAHIRNWLNQFDDNIERRLMFKLLSNIKYYDNFEIREKIRIIHKTISKKLPPIILGTEDTSKQRKDIVISGFADLGKSTPSYARIYRQENIILPKNVVFSDKLKSIISSQNINAIVFIDDIIGSGGTIIKKMQSVNKEIGNILTEKKIKIYITAIIGYVKGIQNIENALSEFSFDFEVYCPDEISENEICNAIDSILYENNAEQEKTIEIIKKYHQRLNLNNNDITPFGYNDDGLLVAFNEACPNNTIPLIWKTEEGKWNALLER